MTWMNFLFWGVIGFGCAIIAVLGVLTRPRHGYSPLVEPAPDAFSLHYPTIESAILAAKRQSIERIGRDLPYVSVIDGKQRVCQCHECREAMQDFQPMHASPPQSVSAMLPYVSPYAQDELYEPMKERAE